MPFKKDENEIGVLWARTSAKGDYMTGEIAGQQVVLFPVKSTNPKAPSWRVLKSMPKKDPADQRTPHDANAPSATDLDW